MIPRVRFVKEAYMNTICGARSKPLMGGAVGERWNFITCLPLEKLGKTGLKLTVLKGGSYGGDMELGAECQREIGSFDSEIRTAYLLSLF